MDEWRFAIIALGVALSAGGALAQQTGDHRARIDAKRIEIEAARSDFREAGCEVLSASFHDADCARLAGAIATRETEFAGLRRARDEALGVVTPNSSSIERVRATISGGSIITIGRTMPARPRALAVEPVPRMEAPLRDLPDQRRVRVVGPAFLPDQEAAIDLRAPGRPRAP